MAFFNVADTNAMKAQAAVAGDTCLVDFNSKRFILKTPLQVNTDRELVASTAVANHWWEFYAQDVGTQTQSQLPLDKQEFTGNLTLTNLMLGKTLVYTGNTAIVITVNTGLDDGFWVNVVFKAGAGPSVTFGGSMTRQFADVAKTTLNSDGKMVSILVLGTTAFINGQLS